MMLVVYQFNNLEKPAIYKSPRYRYAQTRTREGVLIYDNPNDNVIDNYEDYLIYYAASNVSPGLTSGVRCVENSPELSFYKQSYKNLTQGWINDSNGKKYKESIYVGKDKGLYLKHILNTKIGNRYVRADINWSLPLPD